MKSLFFLAIVASLGFIACDTPSPAATSPTDSTGMMNTAPDTTNTMSDSTRTDSTMN